MYNYLHSVPPDNCKGKCEHSKQYTHGAYDNHKHVDDGIGWLCVLRPITVGDTAMTARLAIEVLETERAAFIYCCNIIHCVIKWRFPFSFSRSVTIHCMVLGNSIIMRYIVLTRHK